MSLKRKPDDSEVKLSLLDKLDAYQPSTPVTPPRTPKKAKSIKTTPKTTPSKAVDLDDLSPKARLFLLHWENGIAATKKDEAIEMSGLTVNQQNDMLRRDKGSLRKAVEEFARML